MQIARRVMTVCLGLACARAAAAQPQPSAALPHKAATAMRVPSDAIRVDGRLDEQAWEKATPITDFIQKEPIEGVAPTDPMDVRILFDDRSLFIGARMTSRDGAIQAPLGRRDDTSQAEYILVSLDTFLDRRTATAFGVTAAGVRLDRYHATDTEETFDAGYDLVWAAMTEVSANGWTAELWIPFSQLRFNPEQDLRWGMNIQRFRPSLDEQDAWVLIPRTVRAWASRFGDLEGIREVGKTHRVELSPYVAAGATVDGNRDRANPFDDGRNLEGRVGADLKMGLGPNLTLDATINPDFGQVEADPAEVNLTAFETKFAEKRPFFVEGASLFDIGHPNFYYSRRIGARPTGPASDDFVDYPTASTILGAAKITGRLPSKTSIGVLAAAVDEEYAGLASRAAPTARDVRVAPRAFHTVGRVLQEFGRSGSTAGLFVNYMHRGLADDDPLASLLSRNALALAGSALVRIKGGEYEAKTSGGWSYVGGDAAAIERFQRSSSHYAQRPDRDYAVLDPSLTALKGVSVQTSFNRVSGVHWLWGASSKVDSSGFETNDIAQLGGADGLLNNANLRYRETRPGKVFRAYALNTDVQRDSTVRGLLQTGRLRSTLSLTWANFWTTSVALARDMATLSYTATRGGPLMGRGPGWTVTASVGSRSSSATRVSASTTLSTNDDGASVARVSGSVSIRPGPRWQMSVTPLFDRVTEPQQYISTLTGGRPETYNSRYIFAFIDRGTMSMQYRLGLTLKPDMNLDVYAEPFAASGHYYDYGELLSPRSRERLTYGTQGTSVNVQSDGSEVVKAGSSTFTLRNRDFKTLSFRSNVVLRWEWRAGSTLYIVWQQNRAGTENVGDYANIGDAFRSVTVPGKNTFVIKTSLWLPF